MHVIRRRGWEIPERLATPEHLVLNRRALLAATGAAALSISPKIALAQRISDLARRRAVHLLRRGVHHDLFPPVQHEHKRCAHDDGTDGQQQKNPRNLSHHIFEARHRLGQNGVNRAVFHVLWKQPRSANDRQQRRKKRNRAERNIF